MNGHERSQLDVVEAKVDIAIVKLTYIEESLKDHESRLRSVERWKLSFPGSVLLAVAAVASAVLSRF